MLNGKPCNFEACLCGSLYYTFTTSFYPYAFYNKQLQMLFKDQLTRSKATCSFKYTWIHVNVYVFDGTIMPLNGLHFEHVSNLFERILLKCAVNEIILRGPMHSNFLPKKNNNPNFKYISFHLVSFIFLRSWQGGQITQGNYIKNNNSKNMHFYIEYFLINQYEWKVVIN